MDDLVQWLRAQLDEDERIARAAQRQRGGGEWVARADASGIVAVEGLPVRAGEPIPVVLHPDEDETADHIAEHDPARVLREVEAKRQALAHYQQVFQQAVDGADSYVKIAAALGRQIRIIASIYADRPGYKESWRP